MSSGAKVAIVGYGNVGKCALESLQQEQDLQIVGVVERPEILTGQRSPELLGIPIVDKLERLGSVDVVLLCLPSRLVLKEAEKYLRLGVNTVDCLDLHGQTMWEHKSRLSKVAKENGRVAVCGAGWDPGTDSLIRAIMELMVPKGITFTDFGPGMSLGHGVAAREIEGIEDAVSITFPLGSGIHRRLVYAMLKDDGSAEEVRQMIKENVYFVNDEVRVSFVTNLDNYTDMGHAVKISRKGRAGNTHNQLLYYQHHITNPAVTAQVMVACARSSLKQKPGAYTMLEIPLKDFLPRSVRDIIHHIV